jgi:hypothetical protein
MQGLTSVRNISLYQFKKAIFPSEKHGKLCALIIIKPARLACRCDIKNCTSIVPSQDAGLDSYQQKQSVQLIDAII